MCALNLLLQNFWNVDYMFLLNSGPVKIYVKKQTNKKTVFSTKYNLKSKRVNQVFFLIVVSRQIYTVYWMEIFLIV